jgi:hypothetical protein
MSTFGPLFSAHEIEDGARQVLQDWLPTYMGEVQRQHGVKLPPIKSWATVDSYDRWPEQALPALMIIAGGIGKGGEPQEHGGGFYRATWALSVSVTVEHPKANDARKIARLYAAAIRGVLLQRRTLGVAGTVSDWLDEGYGAIKTKDRRTRAAAENVFAVKVEEVVNWRMGPKTDEPPAQVPADYPEITELDVVTEVE